MKKELHPRPLPQRLCQQIRAKRFPSVYLQHGCFSGVLKIHPQPENCYWLQLHGSADRGRWASLFTRGFQVSLRHWECDLRTGFPVCSRLGVTDPGILSEQQVMETLHRLLCESQENLPQGPQLPLLLRPRAHHSEFTGGSSDVAVSGFAQWDFLWMCNERDPKSKASRSDLQRQAWRVLERTLQSILRKNQHDSHRQRRTEIVAASPVSGKKGHRCLSPTPPCPPAWAWSTLSVLHSARVEPESYQNILKLWKLECSAALRQS